MLDSHLVQRLIDFMGSGVDADVCIATLFSQVPGLFSAVNRQGEVLFANPHHLNVHEGGKLLPSLTDIQDLYPASAVSRITPNTLLTAVFDQDLRNWEMHLNNADGERRIYDMQHSVVRNPRTGEDIMLTSGIDVSAARLGDLPARYGKQANNSFVNFHDPLTGLANRSLFYDRSHKSLSHAKRGQTNMAIMLVDFDRFRNINDRLGREAGDSFLKHAAQSVVSVLRDTDTVARLSGDEFVVVLESIDHAQDIESITEKMLHVLAQPLQVHGQEMSCTASIGVSLYPKDGETIDQLLKHADLAMSRAKSLGKNRAMFYVKAMTGNAVNYLLLENDLRTAIESNEFVLHFQPQIDLRNGHIVGVEALVRWQHKVRGEIAPAEFIPLAEETGLIDQLGEWVLKKACESFQSWLVQGINLGKVAVNLSPRQFRQKDFQGMIVRTLLETGLPPQYLELELTESSAMENAAETIHVLRCLSDMGLSLTIDDFGTGYSSLAYLKRFPINKLKIDRSFIIDIDTNSADAAIAKSIIDLAHNMSLNVVAEGVERASQLRWLAERSCDHVQGFFYSKPISEEALMALVASNEKVIRSGSGIRLVQRFLCSPAQFEAN